MAEQGFRSELRQKALTIAERIITTDGLAALQARRVATEAGCAVGTLYNVFGDMDGLIIAANQETVGLLGAVLVESHKASAGGSVERRLTDLATAYLAFAVAHQNRWRAVFEHRMAPTAEVPEDYRADQARLLALIEEIIAEEVRDEKLRHRAGRALFAAIHGIVALALDEKLEYFDRAATEGEIRFIVSAAAKGLARAQA